MARELLDGRTPAEQMMVNLLDFTALHIELTDGVFRLLYRAHTAKTVKQPDPVQMPRLNAPKAKPVAPKAVSISEAMTAIEGMWA